jgi:3-oxoacyl-[acyl-carrier protein] reductase
MDLGIRGKVALVTGGSNGLGLATAMALAREGVRLAIASRGEDMLEKAAQSIRSSTGAEVTTLRADVASREKATTLVKDVVRRVGPVEILVANAGGPRPGRFADFSWDDFGDAFDTVVGPVHHLVSAALPAMRAARWGRIVSIQSMSIRQPVEGLLLSNSLRPAAAGLLKGLAGELAAEGITVNVVGPGSCRTERILELGRFRNPGVSEADLPAVLGKAMPIGRLIEPDEVGAAVAFLCSAQAAAITGTYLPVDGGQIRSQM